MHIDMKLNFMHIVADLGFCGVSPIYWHKERKHAINWKCSRYACLWPLITTQGYNLDKYQENKEGPNYIKDPNQNWFREANWN